MDEAFEWTKVELLSADENFGLELPIGSRGFNIVKIISYRKSNYLNDGTGAPWAGHKIDTTSFSFLTKRLNFVSEENFGAAPPMGSVDNVRKVDNGNNGLQKLFYLCLYAGTGNTLTHYTIYIILVIYSIGIS